MSKISPQSSVSNHIPSPSFEVQHKAELQDTAPVLFRCMPSQAVLSVLSKTQVEYVSEMRESALQGAQDILDKLEMKDAIEKPEVDLVSGLQNEISWRKRYPEYVKRSEFAATNGQDAGLVVISVDIDNLKSMNDLTGSHTAGDKYFKIVGDSLKKASRLGDENFRKSKGDELAVILWGVEPDVNIDTGEVDYKSTIDRIVAERVNAVREAIVGAGLDPDKYGISAGGAHHELGQSPDELFALADSAMYDMKRAKQTGRV